ncbi:MAG: hypothetical protein R3305_05490, partial [Gammaproteobacteria bacterium]|nr:hypothetical protein [Gammaproteobacteria bacterium]
MSLLVLPAVAGAQAADVPSSAELAEAAARYQALLEQLAEIDDQAKELDRLIERAESSEQERGRGAQAEPAVRPQAAVANRAAAEAAQRSVAAEEATAQQRAEAPRPVAAADRREEAEAQ